MSLSWDITRCADPDALKTDEAWPMTNFIIFATMGTGIGHLTEANLPEFRARVIVAEYLPEDKATIEALRPYIGLRTNVFPQETRAKWLRRVMGSRLDEEVRRGQTVLAMAKPHNVVKEGTDA